MAKFSLTIEAVSDLSGIWNFTYEKWSERQADKYYRMLTESFREIAQDPGIGKNYSGIIENIFGHKVGRHIIFYRKKHSQEIEIIRILHEQMDLKSRIIEE